MVLSYYHGQDSREERPISGYIKSDPILPSSHKTFLIGLGKILEAEFLQNIISVMEEEQAAEKAIYDLLVLNTVCIDPSLIFLNISKDV